MAVEMRGRKRKQPPREDSSGDSPREGVREEITVAPRKITSPDVAPIHHAFRPAKGKPYGCLGCPILPTVRGVQLGADYRGANAKQVASARKTAKKHRFGGKGPRDARVLVVFDFPSRREDDEGSGFSDRDCQRVMREFERAGIPRDVVRLTYAVRCHTPDKPSEPAMKACGGYLIREIESIDPDIIVPVGATAMKCCVGPGYRMDACAGSPFEAEVVGRTRIVFPINTPKMLYFNPLMVDEWISSFSDLADVVNGDAGAKAGRGVYTRIDDVDEAVRLLDSIVDGDVSVDLETNALNPKEPRIRSPLIMHRDGARFSVCFTSKAADKMLANSRPTRTKTGIKKPPKLPKGSVRRIHKPSAWRKRPIYERATIAIVSWTTKPGEGCYVLRDHIDGTWTSKDRDRFDGALCRLLRRKTVRKLFWNAMYERTWFRRVYGVRVVNFRDPMMLHSKWDENASHALDNAALQLTGMGNWKVDVDSVAKAFGHNYRYIPDDIIGPYAAADADAALRVSQALESDGALDSKRYRIYDLFDHRLIASLSDMEYVGVKGDLEAAKAYERYTRVLRDNAAATIMAMPEVRRYIRVRKRKDPLAGTAREWKFNLNADAQIRDLLFGKRYFGREPVGLTKTGLPSVDKRSLEEFIEGDSCDFSRAFVVWRKYDKQHGTYAEAIISQMNRFDGFIHGHFRPNGTVTGRLSSNDPNLQNQPKDARRLYVSAFEDGVLVQVDYSQAEVRVAACLSRDPLLLKIYREGKDVHTMTMCRIFGYTVKQALKLEDEDPLTFKTQRTIAKRIVFGIIYGIGAPGVVNTLAAEGVTIDEDEAQDYIDKFFAAYTGLHAWIEKEHAKLTERGYTLSPFGRRRHLPDAMNGDPDFRSKRNRALRQGPNAIVQGTASDLTTTSIILIDRELRRRGLRSRLVLTVHDSIVLDCPRSEVEEVVLLAKNIMENLPTLGWRVWGKDFKWRWIRCPIVADAEVGYNWRDMAKYDPTGMNKEASAILDDALAKAMEYQTKKDSDADTRYQEALHAA